MRVVLLIAVSCAAVSLVGCGADKPSLNTAPLTDAQKAEIKARDAAVDEEEKSGAGSAVKAKKGK
jgi:hypothetical protein